MDILADENVDFCIFERIKEDGFQIEHIKSVSPGIDDEMVLNLANENQAILLTEDKDFGELVYRLKLAAYGIILIRLSGWDTEDKMNRISNVLKEHFPKMKNSFTTIRPEKLSIRELG